MRILLFRHAKAEKNIAAVTGGDGSPILKSEIATIRTLATKIKLISTEFKSILYSPRLQCEETAKYLSEFINVPYSVGEEILPIKMGVVDGLPSNEIERLYPGVKKQLEEWGTGKIEINEMKIPGMENCFDFYNAGLSFIGKLKDYEKGLIIIGTRSSLILYANIFLGKTPELGGGYKEIIWPNCGYLSFEFTGDAIQFHDFESNFSH